ncbi:hypothetical protein ACI65C_000846 [Semiaphis heraclei]
MILQNPRYSVLTHGAAQSAPDDSGWKAGTHLKVMSISSTARQQVLWGLVVVALFRVRLSVTSYLQGNV